jgi:nucleoside-diphosphate-sugar epimerase
MFEDRIGRRAQVEYGPRHPADSLANQADVTRAGELLGWEAQFDLEQGVSNLINWYNQERAWVSQIRTS